MSRIREKDRGYRTCSKENHHDELSLPASRIFRISRKFEEIEFRGEEIFFGEASNGIYYGNGFFLTTTKHHNSISISRAIYSSSIAFWKHSILNIFSINASLFITRENEIIFSMNKPLENARDITITTRFRVKLAG